ncbi:hypothetical protein GCM10027299_54590 [Larkinella ripae]
MILPFNFRTDPYLTLDFTKNNPDLAGIDLTDTGEFTAYVFGNLHRSGAVVGVGGYNEERVIYRRSPHFNQTEEPRCIHLGVDLWAEAGTPIFAPLDGKIHSFQDNNHFGDYGPTILIEHTHELKPLFSLYGHLSRSSLSGLRRGMPVKTGQQIGEIGPYPENGDWPPHLHFQLMTDLLGHTGDFPGVCSLRERERYLAICPDPNQLLQIPGL